MTARLGWRLLAGGGRASVVRLGLMMAGVAAALLALLVGVAVTAAAGAGAERSRLQYPIALDDGLAEQPERATFLVGEVDDDLGTRPVRHLLLALPDDAVPNRGVPMAWVPPGCASFPAPGQSCVSPQVLALERDEPVLTAHLDLGRTPRQIGPSGLRGPDDLVVYQGVRASVISSHLQHAVAWGDGPATMPVTAGTVLGELGVMVGVPAAVFLLVAARMSSATRLRRMRALRLVGLTRRQMATVAALEGRVAGICGVVLALAAFASARGWVGSSGVVGTRFFPADVTVPAWAQVALVILVPLGVGRLCRVGATRVRGVRTRAVNHRPVSLWRAAPLLVSMLLGAGYLAVHRTHPNVGHTGPALLLVGLLALAGVFLGLRPVAEQGGGILAARTRSLAVRLGARRLQAESAATVRALMGVTAIVLVSGVAAGVLHDVQFAAGTSAGLQTVTVDASSIPASGRAAAAEIPATTHDIVLSTAVAITPGQALSQDPGTAAAQIGIPVHYLSCADLGNTVGAPLPTCRPNTLYRLAAPDWPSHLHPGAVLQLNDDAGSITIPAATLQVPTLNLRDLGSDELVRTDTTPPPHGWPGSTNFIYQLPPSDQAIAQLQDALTRLSPTADAFLNTLDLDKLATYRAQTGLLRFGLLTGFGLSLATFTVAMVDRARERRRVVALLHVVGTGRATLAVAQATELALPTLLILMPAAVVSWFLALVYLTVAGDGAGIYWPPLIFALGLACAAFVLALATGALSGLSRPNLRDLRTE